ncbi:MAG: hypothetical protein HYR88_02260 [Verrucomicrobia bacterium]|nr:hypothetical protein [Verrucomicrobiota bacterium]MBI3870948.1 hypothetical protein [Verrucomicrobiota bacterium]
MANPISSSDANPRLSAPVDTAFWLRVHRAMLTARLIDQHEASLIAQGEASFHVSGAGHEGSALLAEFLRPGDYLHLHYRDKALMVARGTPIAQFFHSLLGTVASHSHGRQMSAHLSDPPRRILSIVGPVGNQALQAAGIAAALKERGKGDVVICSLGDGSTQQGEVLEAIAEAVRDDLPVVFWIADNQFSISTRTAGRTFFSRPDGDAEEFYGLPLHRLDGRNPALCAVKVEALVESVRKTSRPVLALFQVERLSDHTNADDERVYRSETERAEARKTGDPLAHLSSQLREWGVSSEALQALELKLADEVRAAVEAARRSPSPKAVFDAKRPLPASGAAANRLSVDRPGHFSSPPSPSRHNQLLGVDASAAGTLTMTEAIRGVLERRLAEDARVCLLGQDIEDPKGDVFGVTRGLSTDFAGRVRNAPLSESTIVGVSVGRALAGDRPVAMLQFSDFLPIALNQVISEMATMYWRTAGGWECPMILMAPSGGYRPGLGPFHAQSFETLAAHVPGLDVLIPSNAADAARLLNAAFDSGRPTLFFYPKALLHTRDQLAPESALRESAALGVARQTLSGENLTLVGWGNAVGICGRVARALQSLGLTADLIDLCSVSPWDRAAVIRSVEKTRRLIVVHEENLTAGFAAEVLASVAESVSGDIQVRRVTRADTFVPFEFSNQSEVLPSFESVLTAAAELLEIDVTWSSPLSESDETVVVRARGASPTDQETMVVEWRVEPGQSVRRGDVLAELESDKAITELASPVDGAVVELLVPVSEKMPVGTPVARIAPEVVVGTKALHRGPVERQPRLSRRAGRRPGSRPRVQAADSRPADQVWISRPSAVTGSLSVSNALLAERFAGRGADEIFRLCGIESRRRVAGTENALTLAVAAAARALSDCRLQLSDLDAIICHTTTPLSVTPAMASQIHAALSSGDPHTALAAYDVHAACSGFLYCLQVGYDAVLAKPGSRVLVVTTEEMSRVVDPRDFDTAILFGDAATATVVGGDAAEGAGGFLARRPVLFSKPDEAEALSVPNPGSGFVSMRGREVFSEAVRSMMHSLTCACEQAELNMGDLAHIVPHQANGRILEAMRTRLGSLGDRVISNIARNGNTSSSSIPLCLSDAADRFQQGDRIGMCAFGGGFTWGAGLLQAL